jgi:cbb3-type cytochrome oxidase subunit 3
VRSILEAGFIFWGLFAVFAAILLLYLLWMWWTEGKERDS